VKDARGEGSACVVFEDAGGEVGVCASSCESNTPTVVRLYTPTYLPWERERERERERE
jgi:hypothetical protein